MDADALIQSREKDALIRHQFSDWLNLNCGHGFKMSFLELKIVGLKC